MDNTCIPDQATRRQADIELVREALSESMIWVPSADSNEKPCMVRDAQEAFERLVNDGTVEGPPISEG